MVANVWENGTGIAVAKKASQGYSVEIIDFHESTPEGFEPVAPIPNYTDYLL